MKKYKAIGFDYGGVIKGAPVTVFRQNMCSLLGVTNGEFEAAYFNHNKKINRGEVDWEELWTLVLHDLGKPELLDEVMRLSDSRFHQPINQNILDLVDKLRDNGYKTALLSNNTAGGGQIMRREGIDKHFDVFHVSAETGDVKPEPQAFIKLAKELGVDVSELVFIDDAEMSLSTAAQVGFTDILFTSYDNLLNKLSELDIKTE